MTPIFNACQNGHIEDVKYLVEYGADINKEEIDCFTPLSIACQNGHIEVVRYLVEHGVDINMGINNSWTLILYNRYEFVIFISFNDLNLFILFSNKILYS